MMVVVIKAFGGGDDVAYVPGQLVDATEWKRRKVLTDQRFIRPATKVEIAAAAEAAAHPPAPPAAKAKRVPKKRGTR